MLFQPDFRDIGEIGKEQHFFKVKKGEIPISPLLIDLGGWFFDMIYNFWFSIGWFKKEQILRFWPLITLLVNWGHNWILKQKSREPQNAHLGLLLNIHTEFQLPILICWGVMQRANSRNDRNEKSRPKNHFFGAEKGWNGAEKSKPPKGTCRASTKCIYLISTS